MKYHRRTEKSNSVEAHLALDKATIQKVSMTRSSTVFCKVVHSVLPLILGVALGGAALSSYAQAQGTEKQYRVTANTYSETADLGEIVESQFGSEAKIADWSNLDSVVDGSSATQWAESIGLKEGEGVYVVRNGERWANDERHFFLARHDGDKPGNFMAHDQIGGNLLSLGSWYDTERSILVNVSAVDSSTSQSSAPQTGGETRCSAVTIPENWTATATGKKGKSHSIAGRAYRVRQYLAPDLIEDAETVGGSSALVPIPTHALGSDQLRGDRPISSADELTAVLAHYRNVNSNVLSVRNPNEWESRAQEWKEQRLNIYDPQTGKVASGLLLGGKLLASVGASMATADLTGLSSVSVTATDFVINLGSTSLSYYQSVTATPRDKSLAPAMAALADLDPKYRRKVMGVQGSREYLNRYFEASSSVADVATSLKFAASEWYEVASAVQNYRAARDPILMDTPAGKYALTNAHEFMGAALASAGLTVAEEIVFRDVQELTSGFNKLIYTANLYATVLEAYAHQLDTELQRLKEPKSFRSWSAYSEALAQYQYRVGRYHEVKLGLVTNMYEYAKKLNNISLLGYGVLPSTSSLSVPDESVETYRTLMKRQRSIYDRVLEEVTKQTHIIDLVEERYPDFAKEACSDEERGISWGPALSDYSLSTQGQKVLARTEDGVEWRYATERPDPRVARRGGGVAYVIDGKDYRTEASHIYALDVVTGNAQWKKEIGSYRRANIWELRNDTVFVAHTQGSVESRVLALDAETGEEFWVYDEHYLVASGYSLTDDVLLFLDGGAPTAGAGSRSSASLHAVDVETGAGLWSRELTDSHRRPRAYASYDVNGEVVRAENTHTGRTYRIDLRTGEILEDSGPPKCPSERVAELVESALGPFTPNDLDPDIAIDLNGDGVKERFYRQMGTNRRGKIVVIAITGAHPCRQIFSSTGYYSGLEEKLTVLDQKQNGYRVIKIRNRIYTFDGERYTWTDTD